MPALGEGAVAAQISDAVLRPRCGDPESHLQCSRLEFYTRTSGLARPGITTSKLGCNLVSHTKIFKPCSQNRITYSQEKGWHQQFAQGNISMIHRIL